MSETFRTLHGSEVACMATADALTDPRDWGALVAFHHWRDFMRGRCRLVRFRPPDAGDRFFPEVQLAAEAHAAYRRHWHSHAFREATR